MTPSKRESRKKEKNFFASKEHNMSNWKMSWVECMLKINKWGGLE